MKEGVRVRSGSRGGIRSGARGGGRGSGWTMVGGEVMEGFGGGQGYGEV